jgi:uncharacterized protein CbrC (UPF0167 family)
VRNPIDAVCSLRIGIAKNWGHHPRPPDWKDWLERPLLEQCAHHWQFLNSVGYEKVKRFSTLVMFEDLIADPKRFSDQICSLLGIGTLPNASHLDCWSKRVQNTNNENFIEAQTSRNYSRLDHSVRVGRWRENLTVEEAKCVWAIAGDTAQAMGYEAPFC